MPNEKEPTADELLAGQSPEKVPYKDRRDALEIKKLEDEHQLRSAVAKWAYLGVLVQVVLADIIFVTYAWAGKEWDVPTGAIAGWLSATVVQAVAVALVITRYLFPRP